MRVKYLIEKYIENDITSDELKELLSYLDQPEWEEYFHQSLETEKIIREGFEYLLRKKMKEEYEKFETDIPFEEIEDDVLKYGIKAGENRPLSELIHEQKQIRRYKKLNVILSIKCAILVIALICCILFSHVINNQTSGNRLYNEYYKKFNLFVTRAPKPVSKIYYYETVNLYITNQYEEALDRCRLLLQKDPSNMDYRFLYALTLTESGLTDQAKQVYIPLVNESLGKNDMIYAVSTWHVILIYLKEEKPDSSIYYLNTFRTEDNLFADPDRVEELKNKLMK